MLVFFFQGWGLLVPVIFLVSGLAINLITNAITGSGKYWDAHRWPLGLAFLLAGFLSWYIGKLLTRIKPRPHIDKQTLQRVMVVPANTFFFIPMVLWGPILAVIGMIIIIIGLF